MSFPKCFKMEVKDKLHCEFGINCYRKNPRHFELYFHPEELQLKKTGRKTDSKICTHSSNDKKAISLTKSYIKSSKFPKKCDTLSDIKLKAAYSFRRNSTVSNEKKFQRKPESSILTKNKESCGEKRGFKAEKKRTNSALQTKKSQQIIKKKMKTSNFLVNNDECNDSFGNTEENSDKFESVECTSQGFIKNNSREMKSCSHDADLKNKSSREIIKMLFLVDMPPDFYSFYDFCNSVNGSSNWKMFQLGELKLVGPFDILSGEVNYNVNLDLFLCHWRYYYDPPEFQTVLATESGFHIGYWRDDPKENPVFLASNNPNKNCIFTIEGENIFEAVYCYLTDFIKDCDPFKKVKIMKLQAALGDWAKKNNFSLEKKSNKLSLRHKKVSSKTFHGAGIVVPLDAKTDIGYRPLIETDANLKKICKLIMNATNESDRDSLWENLQPLINAANIANDECDFGNGLELGIDLFCMGSPIFHDTVAHLLSTAYALLNRTEFEKIIRTHLKYRRKGNDLSIDNFES